MARLGLFYMQPLWDASMSTSEMRTLAEHTETSICTLLREINQEGAIQYDHQLIEYDEENISSYDFFYYNGVSGDSESEVKIEYERLISQLYRRSAFLTIFGTFEYHLDKCLKKMLDISRSVEVRSNLNKGIPFRAHIILTTVIAAGTSTVIENIDHLRVIRNFIAHNNGFINGYSNLLNSDTRTAKEESVVLSIRKGIEAQVLSMDCFDEIFLNDSFLTYTVTEINRYIKQMSDAVEDYHQRHFTAVTTENTPTATP